MGKNRRFPLVETDEENCCHKVASKKSTLKFLDVTTFAYPQHLYAICECCGEGFEYVKGDNGKLTEVENNND